MSVEVLQSADQYIEARAMLKKRGLDFTSPFFMRVLLKLGLARGVPIGHINKSWDILRTVDFIERHVGKSGTILDLGACSSEMLVILDALHYCDLTGIDLNLNIAMMPHADRIRYIAGDFLKAPLPDRSCDAITAISVIEHGLDQPRLLAELARLLRPGGYFIASVDYWPDKISTEGITAYGMDWTIFSEGDLRSFIDMARAHGLHAQGQLRFDASKQVISWMGREYTFAWFVLQKQEA